MDKLIIFDFDDTLIYTNDIFIEAKESFYQVMKSLGLYDDFLPTVLNNFDIENVKSAQGLKKECFPLALQQTYQYYCQKFQIASSPYQAQAFLNLGFQVYHQPVRLMPGAHELLHELRDHYTLVLLTQGDEETQKNRIIESGLLEYFTSYYIVYRKSEHDYLKIMENYQTKPAQCWSIGNSIRYDVNPALKAGINAIHVEVPCWDYETVEAVGGYISVTDLSECRKYLF